MRTIILMAMLGFLALPAIAQKEKEGKLVGSVENLQEISIAPGSLYAFHRFKYPSSTAEQFSGTIIAEKDSTYFLITKGSVSNKIYAFELEVREKALWLISGAELHTCTSGEIGTDSFIFKEKQIVGCKSGDYKKVTN